MLPKIRSTIKRILDTLGRGDVYALLLILLVGSAAFGLGRLSKIQASRPLPEVFMASVVETSGEVAPKDGQGSVLSATREPALPQQQQGLLVGSKNSDKYHFPWCSGAARIKDENKVWFASREEAQAAGYEPAKNCKGL